MGRRLPKFHDFIGHRRWVAVLRQQLAGAKAHNEPFPSALFLGPSGVGKTLLAGALAAEYGTELITANGQDSIQDLAAAFMAANKFDFVFVDELHGASPKSQELLFQIIDNLRLPRWAQPTATPAPGTEPANDIDVEPCTLIGATDRPGWLLNALFKRMELRIPLGFYTLAEMQEITDVMSTRLNLLLSPQARNLIARASGGLPRQTKQLLQNLRRHYPEAERVEITLPQVRHFLADFGVDENGLESDQQSYIQQLASFNHASVDLLARCIGEDVEFVQQHIEPRLIHMGLVCIGPKGRSLTEAGQKYLGQFLEKENDGDDDGND